MLAHAIVQYVLVFGDALCTFRSIKSISERACTLFPSAPMSVIILGGIAGERVDLNPNYSLNLNTGSIGGMLNNLELSLIGRQKDRRISTK